MIELNETFYAENDGRQWLLHERYTGKDKHGNPQPKTYTTYHATLLQVCGFVINHAAGECKDIVELRQMLQDCAARMEKANG